MSDSATLLDKITALRLRLEKARGLAIDAGEVVNEILSQPPESANPIVNQRLLDTSLRRLGESAVASDIDLPGRLTARVRSLLERGRVIVAQLRALADEPILNPPLLTPTEAITPFVLSFRETAAMADLTLRLVQAFPDAPSAQLRLSEGLEGVLGLIAERVGQLTTAVAQHRVRHERVDALARILLKIDAQQGETLPALMELAETIWHESRQGDPVRAVYAAPDDDGGLEPSRRADGSLISAGPARFVAAHSLNCAQILARLARNDHELRRMAIELILLGLLHDVGMVGYSPLTLASPEGLSETERQAIERHPIRGATLVTSQLPGTAHLGDALSTHHERLDGTGYPSGLQGPQVGSLGRLLAVVDTYAAMIAPRPYRPAIDPRTALTDTLLLAERGVLDRFHAERLLALSFYPVGSVVQLTDGHIGVVVATHSGSSDLAAPARPVLALLTDERGELLSAPRHLDLADAEGPAVVRTLSIDERRTRLGRRYPELAA